MKALLKIPAAHYGKPNSLRSDSVLPFNACSSHFLNAAFIRPVNYYFKILGYVFLHLLQKNRKNKSSAIEKAGDLTTQKSFQISLVEMTLEIMAVSSGIGARLSCSGK
jgi:hypothetical protein